MDVLQFLTALLAGLAFPFGYLLGARDQRRHTRRTSPTTDSRA